MVIIVLDAINILTYISLVLLIGVCVSLITKKLKLPDVLLLITTGVILGSLEYQGHSLFDFPPLFMASISLFTLALIVFNGASKLKLKEFDKFTSKALKLTIIYLIIHLIFFSFISYFILGISIGLGVLFAALLSGSSPDILLTTLEKSKSQAVNILKIESILNTPITAILPFIVLDFLRSIEFKILENFISQISPLLTKIVTGLGAGALIWVALFYVLRKHYDDFYSPLSVLLAPLGAFVLAESIGGDGVIAVTSLGVLFGTFPLKIKQETVLVENVFSKALYVFIFVAIGLVIKIQLNIYFLVTSIALFIFYCLIRLGAVHLCFENFSWKEKIFLSMNATKGIATAAVVFTLAVHATPGNPYYIAGIEKVLNMTLAFMFYSIITTTILSKFSTFFLTRKEKNETNSA